MNIEEIVNNVPTRTDIGSSLEERCGCTKEEWIAECKKELNSISSWLQPYQMCNIERLAAANSIVDNYDELLYLLSIPPKDDKLPTMFGRTYADTDDFIDFIRDSMIDEFPEVAGRI